MNTSFPWLVFSFTHPHALFLSLIFSLILCSIHFIHYRQPFRPSFDYLICTKHLSTHSLTPPPHTHSLLYYTLLYCTVCIKTEEFTILLYTTFNLCKFYLIWKLFKHWTVDKSTLVVWCGDNDSVQVIAAALAAEAAAAATTAVTEA